MPKDIKKIEEGIMSKIQSNDLRMKPKFYFIVGTILTYISLISTIIVSTFLISLIRFYLRANKGMMAQYRFDQLLANFPWWTTIFAIVSLILGLYLIKKYDFSYKIQPWLIIISFILLLIVIGWSIDISGLNDNLLHRGPMRGMMRNYYQSNSVYHN